QDGPRRMRTKDMAGEQIESLKLQVPSGSDGGLMFGTAIGVRWLVPVCETGGQGGFDDKRG
ncbi:hypothetical protein, partial [Bradyrhizobium sp. 62]|uniref:hypothetical protein n=1 Tax=Bradyrhizobium sp. 62 TaxID=1043588 RepID=UPI001FF8C0C6